MISAETDYLFRHALLRDAAYQLQLPGDRARLHAPAFSVLEELYGGRPPIPAPPDAGRASRGLARKAAELWRGCGGVRLQ
ncbi:MAG: hypothetical protein AAB074_04235 [Planctomycetota bacterium]